MRTLALVALGAALLAPPADAHPAYHHAGRCGSVMVSDGGTDENTTWTATTELLVVATDAAGGYAPVPVTVECQATIDGVGPQTVLAASSPVGIAAGATTWSYQAHPDAHVFVCTVVTIGGETHVTGGHSCGEGDPGPTVLHDYVGLVADTADAASCGAFMAAAPGIPGIVDIEPDGDVYVAGEWFWDCAPYGA